MTNVLASLLAIAVLSGGSESAPPVPHIRSSERLIQAALTDGIQLSPSFRGLLERLEASDVVVHIVFDLSPRRDIAGHLAFAVKAGGVRYLRIFLSYRLAATDLVCLLGHELRHAAEIADHPWVVDQASMLRLYSAIGESEAWSGTFDTRDAVAAGDRVRQEVIESRDAVVTSGSHARHPGILR
jgi:hypothetical protein